MAYTVKVDQQALMDFLEEWLGNVFENIKENDEITEIKLRGGDVEITIGEED